MRRAPDGARLKVWRCVRVVLEAEVRATSERERRERANSNGDSLDQLHGTSPLSPPPVGVRCPTRGNSK